MDVDRVVGWLEMQGLEIVSVANPSADVQQPEVAKVGDPAVGGADDKPGNGKADGEPPKPPVGGRAPTSKPVEGG